MKRGHSNIYPEQITTWPNLPDVAKIPIAGGANVDTVKELPPLALRREEWQEIGERMGWAKYRLNGDKL